MGRGRFKPAAPWERWHLAGIRGYGPPGGEKGEGKEVPPDQPILSPPAAWKAALPATVFCDTLSRGRGGKRGITFDRNTSDPPYKKATVFNDYWKAYQAVIPDEQHRPVGKEMGETAHVERWNNTLRQHLARFVRKTLSFSKCSRMHEICLRLFLHRYNTELLPSVS